MAKPPKNSYSCTECGWQTNKWVGRCGECQAWGSLAESVVANQRLSVGVVTKPAVPIGEVLAEDARFQPSGVAELDRVLGGGLIPGAAILLAGEPGVGKSTLLLEVAAQTAAQNSRTLYITGEESPAQVRLRADRTGAIKPELFLAAETDLGAVLAQVEAVKPQLLVIDSVQTINAADIAGVPGGVSQVKEVAAALIRMAKLRNITSVLVGHVTKDGSIAGPRVLEHLVDVVLHFEGEANSRLRMVRAIKNRFGPVDEVGCFDLSATGIVPITDPTGLFLDARHGQVPGTCVGVTLEGRRPLLAEVQALVTATAAERPRRATSGVDSSRIAMILAILQQHAGVRLGNHDVFVSSVGGAKLTSTANDLSIALAIASAWRNKSIGDSVVAIGELGLSGELRRAPELAIRLAEAARLGFKTAIVPSLGADNLQIQGLQIVPASDIRRALQAVKLFNSE